VQRRQGRGFVVWKTQAHEAPLAGLVHAVLKLLDGSEAALDG
jgi:hypothetical protein